MSGFTCVLSVVCTHVHKAFRKKCLKKIDAFSMVITITRIKQIFMPLLIQSKLTLNCLEGFWCVALEVGLEVFQKLRNRIRRTCSLLKDNNCWFKKLANRVLTASIFYAILCVNKVFILWLEQVSLQPWYFSQ